MNAALQNQNNRHFYCQFIHRQHLMLAAIAVAACAAAVIVHYYRK